MDPYLVHCIKFLTINMILGPVKKKKKKKLPKQQKKRPFIAVPTNNKGKKTKSWLIF